MDANRGRGRSVPAAGVLCAVLFLGGGLLIGDLAGSFADSDPQFVDVHKSAGNRARFIVGGYALSASAIAFIWFAVGLSQRLGSIGRITAERHGAIRLGTPAEMRDVARVFDAVGMSPVGLTMHLRKT